VLWLCLPGCAPRRTPYPAALNSERPEERVNALLHAAAIEDRSAVPVLVERLGDEDEAVRFYAILALEKLTGTRHGYHYYGNERQRWRAIQRWRQAIEEDHEPDNRPVIEEGRGTENGRATDERTHEVAAGGSVVPGAAP
jgi:hypothetical protein